jgi:hypothetical protein
MSYLGCEWLNAEWLSHTSLAVAYSVNDTAQRKTGHLHYIRHLVCVGNSVHWHGYQSCHTWVSMVMVTTDVQPVSHGYHWSHVVSDGHKLSYVVTNIPVAMIEHGKCVKTYSVCIVMQVNSQRKSGWIVGDITARLPRLLLLRWCWVSHENYGGSSPNNKWLTWHK